MDSSVDSPGAAIHYRGRADPLGRLRCYWPVSSSVPPRAGLADPNTSACSSLRCWLARQRPRMCPDPGCERLAELLRVPGQARQVEQSPSGASRPGQRRFHSRTRQFPQSARSILAWHFGFEEHPRLESETPEDARSAGSSTSRGICPSGLAGLVAGATPAERPPCRSTAVSRRRTRLPPMMLSRVWRWREGDRSERSRGRRWRGWCRPPGPLAFRFHGKTSGRSVLADDRLKWNCGSAGTHRLGCPQNDPRRAVISDSTQYPTHVVVQSGRHSSSSPGTSSDRS